MRHVWAVEEKCDDEPWARLVSLNTRSLARDERDTQKDMAWPCKTWKYRVVKYTPAVAVGAACCADCGRA